MVFLLDFERFGEDLRESAESSVCFRFFATLDEDSAATLASATGGSCLIAG